MTILPRNHPTAIKYREDSARYERERVQIQALADACGRCHGTHRFVNAAAELIWCRHDLPALTSPSFPNGAPSRTEAEVREQISWSRALDNKARLDRLERAAGNEKPIFEYTT